MKLFGFEGSSFESSNYFCTSHVTLPLFAVTAHAREVVGRVSTEAHFRIADEYEDEIAIRPLHDIRVVEGVELRIPASEGVECLWY